MPAGTFILPVVVSSSGTLPLGEGSASFITSIVISLIEGVLPLIFTLSKILILSAGVLLSVEGFTDVAGKGSLVTLFFTTTFTVPSSDILVGSAASLILYLSSYTPASLPAATSTLPSALISILVTGWVVSIVTKELLSPVVVPNLSLANTLRSVPLFLTF